MHSSKIISLSVPIKFLNPDVATSREVSYEKLVVVFVTDIKVCGGRVGKPEESNGFSHLGFILCDFLLLLSKGLPAVSQVPAIRTEQAACWEEQDDNK